MTHDPVAAGKNTSTATEGKGEKIENPRHLYDILSEIWCEKTCAPRMRERWSRENQTLGQCSITAFLAQDIFGGKVLESPERVEKTFIAQR